MIVHMPVLHHLHPVQPIAGVIFYGGSFDYEIIVSSARIKVDRSDSDPMS